ncbi:MULTISPECIES: hypothetical protein [Rhizobium]|uniref:Uncharacterized protein n=1 Tax=Rhizobium favelukesii TaxID=348824 RepID=W6S6D2_9HYPH|nr:MULTISPECIES: hypothetical protein [Rhizobium]MCA0804556.1 hypothetical protein [Rhizobium sp. T1473]MCS0463559.1 hypothetical protein [Rhizobium favelukesii]UFS80059.1 hypothetical protein LPB79_01810 [Rhizobium sp. T136]CDM61811.1 hypothetical protein LPU83_pLPU83d_0440 [Rhizobium favelukesii]
MKAVTDDAAGEWFCDIVRAIFGSIDEKRHVRNVFGLAPKKNSKTTGGAGIMVTALLMNKRPRAEFLLIGPHRMLPTLPYKQRVLQGTTRGARQRGGIRDHRLGLIFG